MKLDWFAFGSLVLLISIFVFSYVLLQRTIANSARKYTSPETENGHNRRNLSEEERLRIARRMEREVQREQRETERIRQRDAHETAKPSAYSEKIRKREEERISREAEEMRINQDRERQDAATYEKWRTQMQITGKGQDQEIVAENVMEEFIKSVTSGGPVVIDDIANQFGISAQQTVERIREIELRHGLVGCFDDRGRYVSLKDALRIRVDENLNKRTGRIPVTSLQNLLNESFALEHSFHPH